MKSKLIFYILIWLVILTSSKTNAQSGKVPPFRMIQSNGEIFMAESLPFGKPILIIYFSPECDDCQQLTNELLSRIKDFKVVSIAMITYMSVASVTQFVSRNKLDMYSNIYVGTEGSSLFVKNYYNIEQFPFMVLYNKNGDLIKKYNSKEINLDDLFERLKSL